MRRILIFLSVALTPFIIQSQNIDYVKSVVDTLSSPSMHGRGYVDNGDKIAATFICNQFKADGLAPLTNNYFQYFSFPINTFQDTITVKIAGETLKPGRDFVVLSSSPSVSGTFGLVWLPGDSTGKISIPASIPDITDKIMVTDVNLNALKNPDSLGAAGYIFLLDKKVWWHISIAHEVKPWFELQMGKNKLPAGTGEIFIDFKNTFIDSYETQNVTGFIKGNEQPDSFLVFTAHYDHLGMMGPETYFPGANDNASGTSMLLDLAHYYSGSEHRSAFSMAFIAFSGEEAGLLGSTWYSEHPLFPLANIKFLINLDMVGSGSEGIKVVNGSIFKNKFDRMVEINEENNYLVKVSARGEAANSDHYPFYEKGVPCFFIYTLGPESPEYHNIDDTPQNVPFTKYKELFHLLTDFYKTL